jgi:exosome complex RNA-binding protein Csl4
MSLFDAKVGDIVYTKYPGVNGDSYPVEILCIDSSATSQSGVRFLVEVQGEKRFLDEVQGGKRFLDRSWFELR